MIIDQSVWKVCEECVIGCEGVCESVWKYGQWVSQLEYMLFITHHVKIGSSLMKIAQSVWKVCEECVWVCERLFETVRKYDYSIFQLEYILLDTQHVDVGPKLAETAQSRWEVCEEGVGVKECLKVCKSMVSEFPSSSTCFQTPNILRLDQIGQYSQRVWKVCEEFL